MFACGDRDARLAVQILRLYKHQLAIWASAHPMAKPTAFMELWSSSLHVATAFILRIRTPGAGTPLAQATPSNIF